MEKNTLKLAKLKILLGSNFQLCESMLIHVKLNLIKLQPGKECLINKACKICLIIIGLLKIKQKSSIAVFQQKNNPTTLKDKLNSCDLDFLVILLLQTLDRELTGKEKALR